MSSSGNDEVNIRQYLLGRLSDVDREEFEQQYFNDEELFDKLQGAEDDLIDDFLSGNLSQADVDSFHENFLIGSKREQQVRIGKAWRNFATAHAGEKPAKSVNASNRWQWVSPLVPRLGAVAGLIFVVAIGVWQFIPSEVDKGLDALQAAYKQERPFQSRITALAYAPYDPTRGSDSKNVDQNKLNEAALTLQRAVNNKPTPEAHHGFGKVFLAKKEFDQAIDQFQQALKGDPNNAQIYADLGAALFEKGKLETSNGAEPGKATESFARSLENLNKALELDPNLLEALYNRALLREKDAMNLLPQAEEDWRKYLEKDPNSKWAEEARDRLTKIEQQRKTTSEIREEIFQKFLSELNSGDEEAASITLSAYQNRDGNVVVEPLIEAYLEAATQNRKDDADRAIKRLVHVGDLQLRKRGDRFFFDLARFYSSANPKQRELVIQARELRKKAYDGWGKNDLDKSLSLFENARALFEEAGAYPETLVAEYWMSFCHYQKGSAEQSRQIFDPLLVAFERQQYVWLQVRGLYLLSSLEFIANEHSKAVDSALRATKLATSTKDPVGLLNATISLIEYYRYLGSSPKSFAWIQHGLPLITSGLDPIQVTRYYTVAALTFATFGLTDAAIGYEREALRFALSTDAYIAISQNYSYLAAIHCKLGQFDEALKNAQLAFDLAQAHSNPTLMAFSALQMGNIHKDAGEFDQAVARYTEAINFYGEKSPTHLYNAHKGRFLCYLRQQNDQLTQAELSTLFDLINRYRWRITSEDSRNTFFAREQDVVDAAIEFEYSRMKNPEQAFDYSNSAKARSLLDRLNTDAGGVENAGEKLQAVSEPRPLEAIKNQLPDDTQIVQYEVLENKLLIFVISRNNFQHTMQPISRADVNQKLQRYVNLVSRPPQPDESQELMLAKDLYSILIKPVEKLLDKQKLLCIIPDETLSYLPFAALVSPESNRYLVEDRALMTSPSASVFLTCSENALQKTGPKAERVLSVGNPTFDRAAFPEFDDLPHARSEAVEVDKRYKSSGVLYERFATPAAVLQNIENSDVIHFALHSKIDNEVPLRSKLLLAKTKTAAPDSASDSVLYAYEIYNLNLSHARLAVLSSCESGAGRYYGGEGVSSLARAFISAGVPLVVASLWPVQSNATEKLMVSFHSYRAQQGMSTVEALRMAQQQMARGNAENLRRPYYWAPFTVTGGSADF